MSSSDVLDLPAGALARVAEMLAAAIGDPDRIPDQEFRTLIANAIRMNAAAAERRRRDRHGSHDRRDRYPARSEYPAVRTEHVAGDDRQLHRTTPAC
jgi:hypothetical protein